ncbi:MAG: EamA family transporter [Anaerovoracaceae bacterium]|jgi:drug/metabolite transporter (DMT)-like permease|nr:EamA family transporter [Anaerovoracaceae bacterium]
MENESKKALLILVGVNFLWGLDFIVIEYMMDFFSPTIFTMIRTLIGTIVLLVLVVIKNKGLYIKKEDWPRVFISGAVGLSLYFTIENTGVGFTSASFASLIMATVPVFGLIGDRVFYGRKVTGLKIVCVLASIGGVYLLISGEPMGINIKGLITMLAAALLWTFYITYVKLLFDKYDLITLMAGLFLSGMIIQLPITLLFTRQPLMEFTPASILITVASAVVFIIIGEFGYVYAIGKLTITTVSIFENVLPLTAVLFSLFIFGTMLSGIQLIGGVIIMISVTVLALKDQDDEG